MLLELIRSYCKLSLDKIRIARIMPTRFYCPVGMKRTILYVGNPSKENTDGIPFFAPLVGVDSRVSDDGSAL